VISLESCKKDKPIYPLTKPSIETGSITPPVTNIDSSLLVSTIISGLNALPQPSRICSGQDGAVFISSSSQGKVFKVTVSGKITTILQQRKNPLGLTAARNGDVYVALAGENQIVKISPLGVVSTLDIRIGLNQPQGVTIAENGTLYIADTYNRRIVKLTPQGQASVFAGSTMVLGTNDGPGQQAKFSFPSTIRLAADGFLWVVDGNAEGKAGQKVRRISNKGEVSTVFTEKSEKLAILDLAVAKRDKLFNESPVENLFLVHRNNTISHLNTKGDETSMVATAVAGNMDGPLTSARFNIPNGIAISVGNMYIVDYGNNSLRKITKRK
jgi:sugar lactone lactonase YvrE